MDALRLTLFSHLVRHLARVSTTPTTSSSCFASVFLLLLTKKQQPTINIRGTARSFHTHTLTRHPFRVDHPKYFPRLPPVRLTCCGHQFSQPVVRSSKQRRERIIVHQSQLFHQFLLDICLSSSATIRSDKLQGERRDTTAAAAVIRSLRTSRRFGDFASTFPFHSDLSFQIMHFELQILDSIQQCSTIDGGVGGCGACRSGGFGIGLTCAPSSPA